MIIYRHQQFPLQQQAMKNVMLNQSKNVIVVFCQIVGQKRKSLSNTVVSIHFHSVKILLFSSDRSRDFDGMLDTGLPVSMYTTKTPIDMCRFNIRSST